MIERKVLEGILPFDSNSEPALFCAIESALSVDTWLQLRINYKLDPKQCYDTMKLSLEALQSHYQE